MPGKTVSITQDGNKGSLTAYAEFDLGQLSFLGLEGEAPAPGIVPGSKRLELDFSMKEAGNYWEFDGNSSNQYCSFSYSGYASEDKLKLFINDAKLLAPLSPEIWTPAPVVKNAEGIYSSMPLYFDWEHTDLPGLEFDVNEMVGALFNLPVIPVYNNTAYMSLNQAFLEMVKTIAFLPDGNIVVSYVSSTNGYSHSAQTPLNGYQYAITSPGMVNVYVNPLSFFSLLMVEMSSPTPESEVNLTDTGLFPANKSTASNGDQDEYGAGSESLTVFKNKILSGLAEMFFSGMADGFQLNYSPSQDGIYIYVDTEDALDFIAKTLLPAFSDSGLMAEIEQILTTDPALKELAATFSKALELMPQLLASTTSLRIGLELVPYK